MLSCRATIRNKYGIHCRPSTEIAREAQVLEADVTVRRDSGVEAKATNVLQLVGLGLAAGDEVTLAVEGPGEEEAAERMKNMFEKEFEYVPGE